MSKHETNKNDVISQAKNENHSFKISNVAKHFHFESINSTNSWAKDHVEQWANEGITLITALEQTKGKGCWDKKWYSPAQGNLYASFCLWTEEQNSQNLAAISLFASVILAQVLEKNGFHPSIKWPNDILLSGKKVAGILSESVFNQTQKGIVCGIGLNLNMSRDHLNQINQPTTSLFIESGHKYSLNPFLEDIATQFTLQWTNFCLQGFSCVFEAYIKRFYLKKGDLVTFSDHQRQYTGCFEKLFPDGSIQLLLKNGELKQFFSGYSL